VLKYARSLKFEEEPDYTLIKKQFKNRFNSEGYDYDLKFDWTVQPQEQNYSALLASQEKQPDIKLNESNKNNEEHETPPADPQLIEKITKMLEEDHNVSIEVNCTGKSQTSFSKENQDRTGSTTVDKPPAPVSPLKTAPAECKEMKNPEKERTGKKCGCSIF
jgi:hypothetical protein